MCAAWKGAYAGDMMETTNWGDSLETTADQNTPQSYVSPIRKNRS